MVINYAEVLHVKWQYLSHILAGNFCRSILVCANENMLKIIALTIIMSNGNCLLLKWKENRYRKVGKEREEQGRKVFDD